MAGAAAAGGGSGGEGFSHDVDPGAMLSLFRSICSLGIPIDAEVMSLVEREVQREGPGVGDLERGVRLGLLLSERKRQHEDDTKSREREERRKRQQEQEDADAAYARSLQEQGK